MFLSVYCEDSEACDARGIVEMEVEACSKAILALCPRHGKSPCFSEVAFLRLLGVDARVGVNELYVGGLWCHGGRPGERRCFFKGFRGGWR